MTLHDALYAFDLNGYLVIENAVAPDLLRDVNRVVDDYERRANLGAFEGEGEPGTSDKPRNTIRFSRIIKEQDLFLRVAMSPGVIGRVVHCLVDPRLKSTWLDFKARGGGIHYHSNHTPLNPVDAYYFHQRIAANLVTVCYALAEIPEGGGALDVIPGSHKANFPLPTDPDLLASLRRKLPLKAGSAVMFSHDINHGSRQSLDYVRRALFTSFSTGSSAHSQGDATLHDELFEAAPPDSWRKYLLRRPKGDRDSYPQPTHPVEEDTSLEWATGAPAAPEPSPPLVAAAAA